MKLLATSIHLMKNMRARDLEWAATFVQSRFRCQREKRRFKKHLHRFRVMSEMVQTERSYMRSMGIVESIYRTAAARVLSATDVRAIFLNIEGLRKSNTAFWTAMESRLKEWNVDSTVGDIYVSSLHDVLPEYISYVRGYDAALRLHEKHLSTSKYAKVMEECSEQDAVGGLQLGAFLILPIQRFPRYQLLISDMLKHTPASHLDHALLTDALKEVIAHCGAINEATRNTEQYALLQKIERLTGVQLTDQPNRMLKNEIDIHEQVGGKWVAQSVLIFDDLIMSVIKRTVKQVDVQWKVDGNCARIIGDPGATKFELVEYRVEGPVVHIIRPAANTPPQVGIWQETLKNSTTPFSKDDRKRLRDLGRSMHHQKDAVVVQALESLTGIYEIDQGKVATVAQLGKHVRIQMQEYHRGDFFGFECLLRESRFPYEATALSATVNLAMIPFSALADVLAADPLLARRFWKMCCVSLAEQFHLWTLPKTLEKHYVEVSAGADRNLRRTLAPLFAPSEATFRDPERDARTLATFGLPAGHVVVREFEDVQLGNRSRGSIHAGMLYVLGSHFCFSSNLLIGRLIREVFPFASIQSMDVDKGDSNRMILRVSLSQGMEEFYIMGEHAFETMKAAYDKWKRAGGDKEDKAATLRVSAAQSRFRDDRLELSNAQWDVIVKNCGNVKLYQVGEKIFSEGESVSKIFQITRGRCRVEMESEVIQDGAVVTKNQVVGYMAAGELFGERSFLFNGTATATVFASAKDTEIFALDRVQLERLFFAQPELAGGFYKQLALSIEGRLWQRNHRVMQKYSALLVSKVQGGDLSREALFSTVRSGTMVRVGRPVRKESLGQLSALAVKNSTPK